MGIGAAAVVGGLSATGSAAGGILPSLFQKEAKPNTLTFLPETDPLLNAISIEQMALLGGDPASLLMEASPFRRALNDLARSPNVGLKSRRAFGRFMSDFSSAQIGALLAIDGLLQDRRAYASGFGPSSNLTKRERKAKISQINAQITSLRGANGLSSDLYERGITAMRALDRVGIDLRDLAQREQAFQTRAAELAPRLRSLSERAQTSRIGLADRFLSLSDEATRTPNLEHLTELERARLDRGIGISRQEVLRRAVASGLNPAAELEGLSRMTADSELLSIERALGLQGQRSANLAQEISVIQNLIGEPQTRAGSTASQRLGGQSNAASLAAAQQQAFAALAAQQSSDNAGALATGVAAAGQSLSDAYLLSQFAGGKSAPATSGGGLSFNAGDPFSRTQYLSFGP